MAIGEEGGRWKESDLPLNVGGKSWTKSKFREHPATSKTHGKQSNGYGNATMPEDLRVRWTRIHTCSFFQVLCDGGPGLKLEDKVRRNKLSSQVRHRGITHLIVIIIILHYHCGSCASCKECRTQHNAAHIVSWLQKASKIIDD